MTPENDESLTSDEEWLSEQLDALIDAFGITEEAASAAITLASLALEVGDLVAEDYDEHEDEGETEADLAAASTRLRAYADQVLARPAGEAEDDPGEGLDADEVLAMCSLLADPETAEATLSQVMTSATDFPDAGDEPLHPDVYLIAGRVAAMGLGVLAESLEPRAPREARPALRWLQARASETLGDLTGAEEAHEDALTLDATWTPALYDLARMASDRGDAARGLSLLRRSDAGDDDVLVALLQRFVPRDRSDIGRNDPCWCGSGRKYKVCHRGRESLTLVDRLPWLLAKADVNLPYGFAASQLHDLAEWWAASQREPEAVLDALADPVIRDAALFAGDGLTAFADERASLLPDDEQAVLPALIGARRGVFEVQDTGAGIVRLRPVGDLADPDLIDVQGGGLTGVRRAELITVRLVEIDGANHAIGSVELVAPGAAPALAATLAAQATHRDPYALVRAMFDAMPAAPDTI